MAQEPIFRPPPAVPGSSTVVRPSTAASTTPQRNFRVGITQQGPIYLPSELTDDEARQAVEAYDKYIATLTRAWEESSGLQRRQIESQIEDAKKGRENAMEIAQLQAQTTRYGTDVQASTRMAELRQNQAQFDQTHGLDVAKAYTEYASTPDRYFQLGDFTDALSRTGAGMGPRRYGATGTPQAKSWEDFAALQGFNTPAVQAGRSQSGGGGPQASGAGSGGGGSDPRISAASAIMKAIPPSEGDGYDQSDWSALNAIQSVYQARKPGSFERLRPGQQKMFASGLSRMGYYAPDAIEDMRRAAPGQKSVRLA